MGSVGRVEHTGALELSDASPPEVQIGWRMEADARVAVLVVVPAEEALAECSPILDGAKPFRKLGAVLERLELRFGVGIVVRAMWA